MQVNMRSTMSTTARVAILATGLAVLVGGVLGHAWEEEYGAGIDSEWYEQADGTVAIYDSLESSYEVEAIDDSTSVVYAIDQETGQRTEEFRGNDAEANAWYESQTRVLAFEGTPDEAAAWDEARREAAEDMLAPNLFIVVGALLFIVGLAVGWERVPEVAEPESRRPLELIDA